MLAVSPHMNKSLKTETVDCTVPGTQWRSKNDLLELFTIITPRSPRVSGVIRDYPSAFLKGQYKLDCFFLCFHTFPSIMFLGICQGIFLRKLELKG